MNAILQFKKTSGLLIMLLLFAMPQKGIGQILGWNATSISGFGSATWQPATVNPNVTSSGLTRGSSITTSGTAATGCWGGSGGWNASGNDTQSFYITLQAKPGFVLKLSGVSTATRRSNSGPSGYKLYYSVAGGAFIQVGTTLNTSSTSGTSGTENNSNLSSIAALQNVAAGTTVKFRIVPQGNSGNYYLTGGDKALQVTGTVVAAASPAITTSVTTVPVFDDTVVGTNSNPKTFTFSAADIGSNDVSIAAPADFELSTDNINWYSGTDFSPASGSVATTMIWVRFSPTFSGLKSGNITLSANSATTKTIAVSGTAVNGVAVIPQSINMLTYPEGQGPSVSVQINRLVTSGLTPLPGNLVFSLDAGASSNYEISAGDFNWSSSAIFNYASSDNSIESPEIFVRMKSGLLMGSIPEETVTVTGGGFSNSFKVSGNVTIGALDAPVATVATSVSSDSFTANWNTVNGALQYRLDVSTSITFDTILADYDNLIVTGTSKLVIGISPNTTYFYRVRAQAAGIFSDNSNAIEVKTNCQVVALPTLNTTQEFCGSVLLSAIVITSGTDIKWYENADSFTALDNSTVISTTGLYFVSQTAATGCESNRVQVNIRIKSIPPALSSVAQSFCVAATVADLEPKQEAPSFTQVTETFTDPNWQTKLNYTGFYPLTTGIWNASNVGRIAVTTQDSYKRLYFGSGNGPTFIISPAFSGISTFKISAVSIVTNDQLDIIKIVNGVETLVQTVTLPVSGTLVMATFTINVNDNTDGIRIKIAGKTSAPHNIAIGDVVFSYENEVPQINWYDSNNSNSPLTENTSLQTGSYFLSQTVNGCESPKTEIAVAVDQIPTAPIAENQEFCTSGTVANLTAQAVAGAVIKWYADAVSNTVLADTEILTEKSYYVSQTVGICESLRKEVVVTITPEEIPFFDAVAAICSGETLSALPTTSNNGITGSWSPTLDNTTTTEYTFTPNANQCASTQTLTITVNTIVVPAFDAVTAICSGETLLALPTTSNNGITGSWSPALDNTATTEYTFTPDANQCASAQTLTITVNTIVVPAFDAVTAICSGETLLALPTTSNNGITGSWSPALDNTATTTYTFTSNAGQCSSVFTMTITVNSLPDAPTGTGIQDFTTGETLVDFDVNGNGIKWYDALIGGNELPSSTLIETQAVYYASQTSGSCESAARLKIEAGIDLSNPEFGINKLHLYPNPVTDFLTIDANKAIDSVHIFNMVGQLVFQKDFGLQHLKIDLSHLPAGNYIVNTISGDQVKSNKIIVR